MEFFIGLSTLLAIILVYLYVDKFFPPTPCTGEIPKARKVISYILVMGGFFAFAVTAGALYEALGLPWF
jgi:hypothetical protein